MNDPSLETMILGLQECPSLSITLQFLPHWRALRSDFPTAGTYFSELSTGLSVNPAEELVCISELWVWGHEVGLRVGPRMLKGRATVRDTWRWTFLLTPVNPSLTRWSPSLALHIWEAVRLKLTAMLIITKQVKVHHSYFLVGGV